MHFYIHRYHNDALRLIIELLWQKWVTDVSGKFYKLSYKCFHGNYKINNVNPHCATSLQFNQVWNVTVNQYKNKILG